MQRIDLSWVIETFQSIEAVLDFQEGMNGFDAWSHLHHAKHNIETIFYSSVYAEHLRISRSRADAFIQLVDGLTDRLAEDFDVTLHRLDAYNAREAANRFKVVFLSELSTIPAYLVTQKENYSINHLIENGVGLFPSNMIKKAPETRADAEEAGRCLAFELNTACGFHIYRVVESVLRRYWDEVAEGKPRPKIESLGKMANELKDGKLGDTKVSESLVQIARLHRNPLAHPDVILTSDEAIAAIGMARSVLTHMLSALPDFLPTTGTATGDVPG